MERKLLNRIKVVLAEKNKSNKWLSEQLDKDPAIISKWVTNTTQPNVETLIQISKVLGVTVDDLLRTYNPQIEMFARFKMKSSFHKTKRII